MPVERQQGLLINRSRERCVTHCVVMTHTHIIEKQKIIEYYTEMPLHYVQLHGEKSVASIAWERSMRKV